MSEALTFGSWLRQRRKALDLTQEQLADRVSCSTETIRKIETGARRPSREMVDAIAQRLAVPPEERSALLELARLDSNALFTSLPSANDRDLRKPALPTNLPKPRTTFIGRHNELEALGSLLRGAEGRLLTLTGAGGSGKTRLAVQVAADLRQHYQDGVFFVSLAPITDPSSVVSAIARVLGVQETSGQPLIEGVKSYLGNKHLLLLLDNFEHVVAAAPLVADLLSADANLKVLVTSREPLHLYGEHCFPVLPLHLPDNTQSAQNSTLEELYGYEAIDLFVQRAMLVRPGFLLTLDNASAVTQICQRLDGLPLAVELAAARLSALTPRAMLSLMEDRLKLLTKGPIDVPARQQTLRNTIEWSHSMLSQDEKGLFRRLAVFSGGCTFAAMQEVCGASGFGVGVANAGGSLTANPKADVLEGLASLIDKSLVRQQEISGGQGEPRFWMLETIREYARERLQESGEADELQGEHALYFMKLAELAEPHLLGAEQEEWLERLEEEHDNIRAALRWAVAHQKPEDAQIGLRIAGAIWRFWYVRGYLTEGRAVLTELLSQTALLDCCKEWRTNALNGAGVLAQMLGHRSVARSLFEDARFAAREAGDDRSIANSLNSLGVLAEEEGDNATARTLYEQSLVIRREIGDKWGIAGSLNNLGSVAAAEGAFTLARTLYEQSLAIGREIGNKVGISLGLTNLAHLARSEGDFATARALYEQSLAIERELGHKRGIAGGLNNLGRVAQLEGDFATARLLLEQSLVLTREIGYRGGIVDSLWYLANVAHIQQDYPTASALYKESLVVASGTTRHRGIALILAGVGAVEVESGRPTRGARLLGAAEVPLAAMKGLVEPADHIAYNRGITSARAQLGEEGFEKAREEGRAMSMEQAIEYACERLPEGWAEYRAFSS